MILTNVSRALVVWAVAYGASAGPAHAQANRRLNDPGPQGEQVRAFAIAGGGRHIVYRQGAAYPGPAALYTVPRHCCAAPVLLSGDPAQNDVRAFAASPDGRKVVFAVVGPFSTWVRSAPVEGPAEAATQLIGLSGVNLRDLWITPDSQRVVLTAENGNQRYDAFSVPIDASSPAVQLNGLLPPLQSVAAPTNSHLVSVAGYYSYPYEVYSVPLQGPSSAAVKLNLPLGVDESITEAGLTPDGGRALYLLRKPNIDIYWSHDLYSVPTAGPASAAVKLSDLQDTPWGVVTPDSSHMAYVGVVDTQRGGDRLKTVPVQGPASAGVSVGVPGASLLWYLVSITPDSARVVYFAEDRVADQSGVFSVPLLGPDTANVRLSGPDHQLYGEFYLTSDSALLVHGARLPTDVGDRPTEIYSVPIQGPVSARVKLTPPLPPDVWVYEIAPSPDGRWVLYSTGHDLGFDSEMYVVPVTGGPSSRVSGPLVPGGQAVGGAWTPDSLGIAYLADQEVDNRTDLYLTDDLIFSDGFQDALAAARPARHRAVRAGVPPAAVP